MKKFLPLFLLLPILSFVWPTIADAQLGSISYPAVPGEIIRSSEFNANLSNIHDLALNRQGGTMTGTLNTRDVLPVSTGIYDLGSTGVRFQGIYSGVGNFSGLISSAGGLRVTGGASPGVGSLWADTSNGLALRMVTGSLKDYQLLLPNGTEFASIATGTSTLTVAGTLAATTITASTISGSGTGLTGVALLGSANALTDTTDSSSSTTGALKTAGGLGVAKALNVGTTLRVTGLFTGNGGAQFVGTTAPASGSGVEVTGGAAPRVQAYNRTGSAYLALLQDALSHGFLTSNTLRWGVDAAGDWVFGASSHIADSSGTPSTVPNAGSVTTAGVDYAFKVTVTGGVPTSYTVTFGHTFASPPICAVTTDGTATANITSVSTTQLIVVTSASAVNHYVLCRGY